MDVADRIFLLLSEQHMEQKEFAKTIGVIPQTVTDWKNKKSKSYTKYLSQIATALNTSVVYLLNGTYPKTLHTKFTPDLDTAPESSQAPVPKDGGLTEEFAKLFVQLTPENQNRIIAEMLKRQREQ